MNDDTLRTWRIDGDAVTLVFVSEAGGAPIPLYFGPKLPPDCALEALLTASARERHENQANRPVRPSLLPTEGRGFLGQAAVVVSRGGRAPTLDLRLAELTTDAASFVAIFADARAALSVKIDLRIDASDAVIGVTSITNDGRDALSVHRLASLALPLPDWVIDATHFSGRWAAEMQMTTAPIEAGATRASRGGKPGFAGAHWALVSEKGVGQTRGRMVAAHLAWSGDGECMTGRNDDGVATVSLGAPLAVGEVVLAAGCSYAAPAAVFAFSDCGSNGLRKIFHAHVRTAVLPERGAWPPRRVHLNSWDGLGFDIDAARLTALADQAAVLGVERFVVDDGWFRGRCDDRRALGDWSPDTARFPEGLDPLIAHVTALGMDFGIWVEPEMVSVDSDLYRAHPDWCIHLPGEDRLEQRQQLVLDLSRAEVAGHLFATLDALLGKHAIAYLKWDHNRDLFPLSGGAAQANALLSLLDRIRAAHPLVEIETCSSGGGRIAFDILGRCHRVWPSDNNDPIERLRINTAWSLFLPPEIIGSHVGPARSPQTGRTTSLDFRAKVAVFGHMGIEADPARLTASERERLARIVGIYKEWRDVMHRGAWRVLDDHVPGVTGIIAGDDDRYLALVAQTKFAETFEAPRIRLPGLDAARSYRVRLLDPWPPRASHYLANPDSWREGIVLPGVVLGEVGLALPLAHPETAWLVAVEAC